VSGNRRGVRLAFTREVSGLLLQQRRANAGSVLEHGCLHIRANVVG